MLVHLYEPMSSDQASTLHAGGGNFMATFSFHIARHDNCLFVICWFICMNQAQTLNVSGGGGNFTF